LSVVPEAGGKLVLHFLLLPQFLAGFARPVTPGERVESLQSRPLLLPFRLTGGGMGSLPRDGLELLADGLVEPAEESLIVAPFGLSQSVLRRLSRKRAAYSSRYSCSRVSLRFTSISTASRVASRCVASSLRACISSRTVCSEKGLGMMNWPRSVSAAIGARRPLHQLPVPNRACS
jgi:hypothetical protein